MGIQTLLGRGIYMGLEEKIKSIISVFEEYLASENHDIFEVEIAGENYKRLSDLLAQEIIM